MSEASSESRGGFPASQARISRRSSQELSDLQSVEASSYVESLGILLWNTTDCRCWNCCFLRLRLSQ